MQRVVLCLTVTLALVFSASLGAGATGAQSAGGDNLRVSKKTVKKFVKRKAMILVGGQPAVFPNARITDRKASAFCHQVWQTPRRWSCAWSVRFDEQSRSKPNQSSLRHCGSSNADAALQLERARSSRRLRIVSPWQMSCELSEVELMIWNAWNRKDWYPDVTEPTPYEPLERPRIPPTAEDADDLDILPPPSGEPGTPPLGPLEAPPSDSATSSTHDMTCSGWERYQVDTRYWIYVCYYRDHSIFGAGFNTIQNYSLYYWAGDRNSDGYATGRLFYTGVVPQINYVHS